MLYYDLMSVDCEGFIVYNIFYCDLYCWKMIWFVCLIIIFIVWFCLFNIKMLLRLRLVRNKKIFWSIIKKFYFWFFNIIVGFVVFYDVLIMVNNRNVRIYVECLVVVFKLWILYLLF